MKFIHLIRGFFIFSLIYIAYLASSGFHAGMLPVWGALSLGAFGLSFKKIYKYVGDWLLSHRVIRYLLLLGISGFILLMGAIIMTGQSQGAFEKDYDYVLVLGAGLHGDQLSLTLKYRLDQALKYQESHEETIVLVTGGQGPGEDLTEARAMADYLLEKGVAPSHLLLEEKSTTTYENLVYSKEVLLNAQLAEGKGLLITSDFHVLRAMVMGEKMALQLDGLGSRTLLYLVPNYYLREVLAILKNLPHLIG